MTTPFAKLVYKVAAASILASGVMTAPAVFAAAELKAVRQDAPDYPRLAERREIEGWVKVKFTVTADGEVENPVVVEGNPAGVFDSSAIRAVARWRYENPNAESVEEEVKLDFKLGG